MGGRSIDHLRYRDNGSVDAPLHTQPKIIELFALKVDDETFEIQDELELLIDPKEKLTDEIKTVTGITDDMLLDRPTFSEVRLQIMKFWLGQLVSAGHNVTFDCDMLEVELRRIGAVNRFPWSPFRWCSVELSEHYLGRRLKLIDLHTHLFGVGFEKAHRARNDVMATYRCLAEMKKRGDLPNC